MSAPEGPGIQPQQHEAKQNKPDTDVNDAHVDNPGMRERARLRINKVISGLRGLKSSGNSQEALGALSSGKAAAEATQSAEASSATAPAAEPAGEQQVVAQADAKTGADAKAAAEAQFRAGMKQLNKEMYGWNGRPRGTMTSDEYAAKAAELRRQAYGEPETTAAATTPLDAKTGPAAEAVTTSPATIDTDNTDTTATGTSDSAPASTVATVDAPRTTAATPDTGFWKDPATTDSLAKVTPIGSARSAGSRPDATVGTAPARLDWKANPAPKERPDQGGLHIVKDDDEDLLAGPDDAEDKRPIAEIKKDAKDKLLGRGIDTSSEAGKKIHAMVEADPRAAKEALQIAQKAEDIGKGIIDSFANAGITIDHQKALNMALGEIAAQYKIDLDELAKDPKNAAKAEKKKKMWAILGEIVKFLGYVALEAIKETPTAVSEPVKKAA